MWWESTCEAEAISHLVPREILALLGETEDDVAFVLQFHPRDLPWRNFTLARNVESCKVLQQARQAVGRSRWSVAQP